MTLPPITGTRSIDWLNEQLPHYPLITSNINLAAWLVIQDNQPLQEWIRGSLNGMTPMQALNGFWGRAIIAAVAHGGNDASHVPSDWEYNAAEQRLLQRIDARIPGDWKPTPRPPVVVDPGDMGGIFRPTLTDDQLRAAVRARGWQLIERADLTAGLTPAATYRLPSEVLTPNNEGKLVPDVNLFDRSLLYRALGVPMRPTWWTSGHACPQAVYNDAYAAGQVTDSVYYVERGPGQWDDLSWSAADLATIARRLYALPAVAARWGSDVPAALARVPA